MKIYEKKNNGVPKMGNPPPPPPKKTNEVLLNDKELWSEILETLCEAQAQIRYLHDKFKETGSGNAVLAKIDNTISKLPYITINKNIFYKNKYGK